MPCQQVGHQVEVRLTCAHAEVLLRDQRIALRRHVGASLRFVADTQHMPADHRAYADPWIMQRAARIGPVP